MMTTVLAFHGSRGDVQPGVALGVALSRRGHSVRMAVPPNLVGFAARSGLDAYPCGTDTAALLASDLVTRDSKSRNPVRRMRAIAEIARAGSRAAQADLAALCTDAEVVVGGSVGQERVLSVAEALGIPYVPVHLCPLRSNSSVALVEPGGLRPGPTLTRASWRAIEHVLWLTGGRDENRLRAELGLKAAHSPTARRIAARGVPEIQAYDSALFADLAREWGERRPLVGFLDLDRSTRVAIDDTTDDVESSLGWWLDAGPPPIYVGFGSMSAADPGRLAAAVLSATADHRVLVATGWSDFLRADSAAVRGDDPVAEKIAIAGDRIRLVRTVDHAAVLPRCSVVVHHGGAGSTAAGLRAGRPTVICSLGADQPMWGRAVSRLRVGTALRLADVTAQSLHAAIDAVGTPAVGAAAAAVAHRLTPAAEAAESAVDIIESTLSLRK